MSISFDNMLYHSPSSRNKDYLRYLDPRTHKFDTNIKSVKDCLLWCMKKGPVQVQFHGFSAYEDYPESIRGLALLQNARLNLATSSNSHYPLRDLGHASI